MKSNASLTEINNSGQSPIRLALLSKKKDCFNTMVENGLFKKVNRDFLLQEAEAARDFQLVFSLTVQLRGDWSKLTRYSDLAKPSHLQLMSQQLPTFGENYVLNILSSNDKKNALEMMKKL